jgi:hypothetical protein
MESPVDYNLNFVASSKNIKEYNGICELAKPLMINAELVYESMIKAINNKEYIS